MTNLPKKKLLKDSKDARRTSNDADDEKPGDLGEASKDAARSNLARQLDHGRTKRKRETVSVPETDHGQMSTKRRKRSEKKRAKQLSAAPLAGDRDLTEAADGADSGYGLQAQSNDVGFSAAGSTSLEQRNQAIGREDCVDVGSGGAMCEVHSAEPQDEPEPVPVAGDNSQQDDSNGFTVLEDRSRKEKATVHRALPAWLARPHIIKGDIRSEKVKLDSLEDLCPKLRERLKMNGITHFFPVQQFVIPVVLESAKNSWYIGSRGGYRPSDVCCSAPTGSGKTLAFVLPIIQTLQHRVVPKLRALVVLPVRDLAAQVYKVFLTYAEHTSLRVGLIVGQKNLASEQASLVKPSCKPGEYSSLVDIIVATPGRLVDHIRSTEGFDLSQLRFLVIDEADRMMDEIKQDWLSLVEGAISRHSDRELSTVVTAAQESRMQIPLQKLLFSATLSQNPEKLQQLNLFHPQLYTSVASDTSHLEGEDGRDTAARFEGKYTTPSTLTEYFVECTSDSKPLALMYLIMVLKFQRVLCFTNSVETTRRLYNLLDLVGGGVVVRQFSSAEHAYKRTRLVKQFEAGKVHVLVCSDAMARGMDIKGVKYVISYDNPPFVKTYIHRVGRTARAGKAGTAITFLEKNQVHHFKEMMKLAGKGKNVKEMKIKKSDMKPLVDTYTTALARLPDVL